MSWVCSRVSTTPMAAKPSPPAIPYGCQARSPGRATATAADSRPPVASMISISPSGVVPGSALISNGTYAPAARPVSWAAYAAKSLPMWTAVS